MKNPLVIFVGAAVATLAALIWVTSGRWQKAEVPAEILSQVQEGPATSTDEPKVAVAEPPSQQQEPASQAAEPEKPAQPAGEAEKPAESAGEQQAAVDPGAQAEQPQATTPQAGADQPAAQRGEKGGTFDVVRMEPNGEAVFAGRCDPGAEVALLLDGAPIGRAKANEAGEWLIVPDAPIPPGSHEITIESTNPNGRKWLSQQTLAVHVEPDKKPLIVLSTPNEPSKVLQKPEEQVAVVEPEAPAAPREPETKTQADAQPSQAPQSEAEAPAAEAPAAAEQPQPEQTPAAPRQQAAEAPKAPEQPAAEAPATPQQAPAQQAAEAPSTPEAAPEQQQTAEAPATSEAPPDEPAKAPDEPAADQPAKSDQMATAEPQAGGEQTPPASQEQAKKPGTGLSLDTVDYNDKGDIIFSGKAEPGNSVRLYVDNKHVGDAIADTAGAWSFAGREQIDTGAHRLRADLVDRSGSVSKRIELPFVRADPDQVAALQAEQESGKAVAPQSAQVPKTASGEQQMAAADEPRSDATTRAGENAQPGAEEKSAPQVPAETPSVQKQAEAQPEAPSVPEVSSQPETPPQASSEASEQPSAPAKTPSAAEQQAAAEQSAPEANGKQDAEAPTQKDDTTQQQQTAAAGAEQPEPQAKPAPRKGKVVIQPGNNLWRISRVIYGKGVQYTTIYEANKEQIRDPDLIYPGQIFTTPDVVPPEEIDPGRRDPLSAEEMGAQ